MTKLKKEGGLGIIMLMDGNGALIWIGLGSFRVGSYLGSSQQPSTNCLFIKQVNRFGSISDLSHKILNSYIFKMLEFGSGNWVES